MSASSYLALEWGWDADDWTSTWATVPGSVVDQARDPVGTAADTIRWDDVQDGRWGAVAGGLTAAAVAGGVGRVIDEVVPGGLGGGDRPRGPDGKFLPQSFDEMLAGVDLVRNDDQEGAHTLARHVDVDDDFLKRRLLTGGVEGGRTHKPPELASRWTDLETAERVLTDVLRFNEDEVRGWLAGGSPQLTLRGPVPEDVGSVWRLVDGVPAPRPARSAVVVLVRGDDGSPVIKTAYVNP